MSSQVLKFERRMAAPVAEAYRAFTRSVVLREWLCDTAVAEARKGGRLYLSWNTGYYAVGQFTALVQNRQIAFTWRGRDDAAETQVEVALASVGDGVDVTLTHAGFGSGPEWDKTRDDIARGWETGLENLQSVLESGRDLRYVHRPMLGIYPAEFDAEVAARLGVPVVEGLRLGGVVKEMGAVAAGLKEDDVIVSIGGKPVPDSASLTTALQSHRAGDTVKVVYYRGGAQETTDMTLSARPLPEVSTTAQALAAAVRKVHAGFRPELEKCLAGVSDAEAAYHPAAGEWNALETMAHVVANEREIQAWIADLVGDDERWSDRGENPAVVPARIGAIARVYPTVAAMTGALVHSQDETAAMVDALPAEFVAHKCSFWRLGRDILQLADHANDHLSQMRAAIQAARSR